MNSDLGGGSSGGTARYSVPQVARMLGISERAVRKQIETGKLSAERDGNRWLIALAEPDSVPDPEPRGTGAVPSEPKRGTESEPIDVDYRPVAAEASQRYLDELRDIWLMPLIHENGDLRERIGRLEAERDALQREHDELRATLKTIEARPATTQVRETPAKDESPVEEPSAPQTPKNRPRWRFWERLKGQ